jgi:hypothetical protein
MVNQVFTNGPSVDTWRREAGLGMQAVGLGLHPIRLERHWYLRQYESAPVPWSMFFFRGFAVHGRLEARYLGHAASHGCVRLRPDHAAALFSLARKRALDDTEIVVTNGPVPPAPVAVRMAATSPQIPLPPHPQVSKLLVAAPLVRAPADDGYVDVAVAPRQMPPQEIKPPAKKVELTLAAHARVYDPPARHAAPPLPLYGA